MHEKEIERDIPLLYNKIAQCNRSILDYERNIFSEQGSVSELNKYIQEDVMRSSAGKRVRYDAAEMLKNIDRHNANIELFNNKIVEENTNIKKFENIIEILREDSKRPTELIIDMRTNKRRG